MITTSIGLHSFLKYIQIYVHEEILVKSHENNKIMHNQESHAFEMFSPHIVNVDDKKGFLQKTAS